MSSAQQRSARTAQRARTSGGVSGSRRDSCHFGVVRGRLDRKSGIPEVVHLTGNGLGTIEKMIGIGVGSVHAVELFTRVFERPLPRMMPERGLEGRLVTSRECFYLFRNPAP